MLKGNDKVLPPSHPGHKISPRKFDVNGVFLGELSDWWVRIFSLTDDWLLPERCPESRMDKRSPGGVPEEWRL